MSLFNSSLSAAGTERLPQGFFAYAASPPMIPSTIKAAIQGVNKTQATSIKSWEELRVSGKVIISEICAAIEQADFLCADVTGINPNVMFEIGYAIAMKKRIARRVLLRIRAGNYRAATKALESPISIFYLENIATYAHRKIVPAINTIIATAVRFSSQSPTPESNSGAGSFGSGLSRWKKCRWKNRSAT
jgi:hypothetical protein